MAKKTPFKLCRAKKNRLVGCILVGGIMSLLMAVSATAAPKSTVSAAQINGQGRVEATLSGAASEIVGPHNLAKQPTRSAPVSSIKWDPKELVVGPDTIDATNYSMRAASGKTTESGTATYHSVAFLPQYGTYTSTQTNTNYVFGKVGQQSSLQGVQTTTDGTFYALYNEDDGSKTVQNHFFIMAIKPELMHDLASNPNYLVGTNGQLTTNFATQASLGNISFSAPFLSFGHGQGFSSNGKQLYFLDTNRTSNDRLKVYQIDPTKQFKQTLLASTRTWYPANLVNRANRLDVENMAFTGPHTFYYVRTNPDGVHPDSMKRTADTAPALTLFKGNLKAGRLTLHSYTQGLPAPTVRGSRNVQLQGMSYDKANDTLNISYNGVVQSFNLTNYLAYNNKTGAKQKFNYDFTQLNGAGQKRETESTTYLNGKQYLLEGQNNEILTKSD
ncbi:hypothetical protein BSQ39_05485 [Loigolactobacillus backii]|uniref:hypothetical protein n=1 Tax=Loigolactobacillus backii TaxID=375175 RepID=UPI000C1CBEA7|nr:hypothetical protein [Loigolactobacillus backii]PIO83065.1 hypothetical protein BSQ39_05485 [Loigolactobacillus backii]